MPNLGRSCRFLPPVLALLDDVLMGEPSRLEIPPKLGDLNAEGEGDGDAIEDDDDIDEDAATAGPNNLDE